MLPDEQSLAAASAKSAGRMEEAERLYWDLLKSRPGDADALFQLGVIQSDRREFRTAVELFRKSLTLSNNPKAHNALGLALTAMGKPNEAIAAYRQTTVLDPQNSEAYNNLANTLLQQGSVDSAIEAFRKTIQLKPDLFLAHYNLGVAFKRQNKFDEAIAAFKQAVYILPTFSEAYCNIGLILAIQGKEEEAIAAYRKALELRPDFAEALNNLGQPLHELGRLEEAAEAYQHAVAARPNFTDAFINLALIMRKRGMLPEAIDACRTAITTDPANAKAQIELIDLRREICDWSDANADMRQLFALIQDVEPFVIAASASSMKEQLFCARRWAAKIPHGKPFTHNRADHIGRLRIGYLSNDFCSETEFSLLAELFERHDRSRFEIFGYAYGAVGDRAMRQRITRGLDHFVDFASTPNNEIAQRIYKDKIDILVDLRGYAPDARPGIIADKPAPVQVNFVGYPGTLGAGFVDYILADPVVAPTEHQPHYAEQIVHLPHCYLPHNTKRQSIEIAPTRSACGLPEQGFVFCCFNSTYKISPAFFDVWMRLLNSVQGSVLWLRSAHSAAEANLRREAAARGVNPQRLIFAPTVSEAKDLARIQLADLVLDTLPYGTHSAVGEVLEAGVPFLTCVGETLAGRVGSSALRAAGLPELVTNSIEEYEARALEFASRPDKLAAMKQKLVQNATTASFFDIGLYTRNLETAFTRMGDTWRQGNPPQAFAVDKS